jgi:hypothetical protein
MGRKHVRAPLHKNSMRTKSHNDGQNAGYFLRTLRTMLLASPRSSLEPQGCFVGIRTFGLHVW